MKRTMDLALATLALCLFAVPMLVIALLVKVTSPGPVLYWSNRVGRGNRLFPMPKFRSMRVGTPAVATHLLTDSRQWITPLGLFLRKTSLDELPQLWNIFTGEMSVVGPRPALFNQADLIAARTACGVHELTPGLTGWAQINGRDELAIPEKVRYDAEYASRQSLWFDTVILFRTVFKVARQDGIRQADEPTRRAA
jgi:O-antigen biosynthesis protein WbqP